MNEMTALEPCRLDETERRNLEAAVLRVIPSDDGAGAAEAGCPEYVIRVVEERLKAANTEKIKRGLAFTEKLSQQICGCSFADAETDGQDQVLLQLQRMPHPTIQTFFHRLVNLTLEGFLCDPRHGGNRERVGWRYLGFDAPSEEKDGPCTTSSS